MAEADLQVSLESTEGLKRRIRLSLPARSFEDRVADRTRVVAREARVNGFRPGKMPVKEASRRFGASIRREVAADLMQESFFQAAERESYDIAGPPVFDPPDPSAGGQFTFVATFEVMPEIKVADLSDIRLVRPEAEVTPDDIDEMIQTLRERSRKWETADRPAEEGDLIVADFTVSGEADGDPRIPGKDARFIVGTGGVLEDIDQAIRGMSAGETKEFPATVPDDSPDESLRGSELTFEVAVTSVEEPVLPPLDDAFFRTLGVREGGEPAFREEIRKDMQARLEAAIRQRMQEQVLEALADIHDFALPEALVERERAQMSEDLRRRVGLPEQSEQLERIGELVGTEAEKRVKTGLVLKAIVAQESLTLDANRLRERIEGMAERYEKSQEVIEAYYGDERLLQSVEQTTLTEQVIDHVAGLAKVETVQSTFQDVMSGKPASEEGAAEQA